MAKAQAQQVGINPSRQPRPLSPAPTRPVMPDFQPVVIGDTPVDLSRHSSRIVAIHFPFLATDRTWRGRLGAQWRSRSLAQDAPPLVHAGKERNAMRILEMDEAAQHLGLRKGQGLADARSAHPDLDIVPEDKAADRALLNAIADWCDRYTPLVALSGQDGLFLDVTGCVHLFGGEEALLSDLLMRLFHQGLAAQGAISSFAGAAHAAARFSSHGAVVLQPGVEAGYLSPFPVRALRLDGQDVAGLEQVGLKTIGDLIATPRAPLTRRFGRGPILQLERALGMVEEALSPRLPVPDISAERRLAEPVGLVEHVEQLLFSLSASVKQDLERRDAGARLLELTLFRVDGAVTRLMVGASRPLREPEHIVKLFRERIAGLGDDFDAGYGFDLLRLNVLDHGPFEHRQGHLDEDRRTGELQDVRQLMDRIAARLCAAPGERAIHGLVSAESHVPEHVDRLAAPDFSKSSSKPDDETASYLAARPVRLLAPAEPVDVLAEVPEGPPVRFRWRRVSYHIVKAEGPERIGGEWWCDNLGTKGEPNARDYYAAEDEAGRRFWLYREGLYGARGKGMTPRWFIHGLLA